MVAVDTSQIISSMLNRLFDYVKSDESIADDVKSYIDGIVTTDEIAQNVNLENLLLAYVFDRKIDNKSIMDLFLEKNANLTDEEIEIIQGIKKSIYSIFEIKKIVKNGFQLYNLVNEKLYDVSTLIKSVNFRGIGIGQFLLARIFPYQERYYISVLNNVYSAADRAEALRYAVMIQMEMPESLYDDNIEKLNEIEAMTAELKIKFNEYFNASEIVTTTESLDEILAGFNDYVETGDKSSSENISDLLKQPDEYKYFDITKVESNNEGDFIDRASKGFSSADAVYDVGLMYDEQCGLLVVPFYNTFKEIFKKEDYKSIEGYEDCIKSLITDNKVPPSVIEKVAQEFPHNFLTIVKEVLGENEISETEDLLRKYKKAYYEHRKFSVPTILYSSKAFNKLMHFIQEDQEKSQHLQVEKVGRNDLCPCRSGKKYKKCCMN